MEHFGVPETTWFPTLFPRRGPLISHASLSPRAQIGFLAIACRLPSSYTCVLTQLTQQRTRARPSRLLAHAVNLMYGRTWMGMAARFVCFCCLLDALHSCNPLLCFLHHNHFKMEIDWRSIQDGDGKQKYDDFFSICYGKSSICAMSY
jgi:hypothetical protein